MVRRFRMLRLLKWSGMAGVICIGAVLYVSAWWRFGWTSPRGWWLFDISGGDCGVVYSANDPFEEPGFHAVFQPSEISLGELPEVSHYPASGPIGAVTITRVPLWLPITGLFFLTILFWFLDRRYRRPGHCRRCNYDLTGNLSGVCPECGKYCAADAGPAAG